MKDNRLKKTTTVSIYHDQTEKFKELGGSEWLRNIIDSADSDVIRENRNHCDYIVSRAQALRKSFIN